MNTRPIAIALIGLAVGASQASAQSTEQRLIDYGFLPPPITPSTVVDREPARPVTITEQRLMDYGFARPEMRVTTRYEFVRQQVDTELTETERRLQEYGFLPKPLRHRTEPVRGHQ